jgi:hypothetical protein
MNPDHQPAGSVGPVPSRGRLTVIFSALAVFGLLLGVGAAQLTGSNDDANLVGAVQPKSPGNSAQPTDETPVDETPSADAGGNGPADYHPIPADPTTEPDLDFGFLTRVVGTDGQVTLRLDRATFYTGEEAKAHNKGKEPDSDYVIENTNTIQREFTLDPQASITAANRLRTQTGQVGTETLSAAQFVQNAQRELTASTDDLAVWLRHTDGLTGPVTAIAEQYLP